MTADRTPTNAPRPRRRSLEDTLLRETLGDDGVSEGYSEPRAGGDALPRGATVGRYVVLERIGSGGMGVVYAAYDPDLDRRVALKVLRAVLDDSAKGAQAKARLLREGQAMARVHHPNVIAVHDVGTDDGRTFIAMEFIDGWTLSDWIDERSPSRDEVLRVYRAAGEGLAAAHAQGLIHRDFKPDNVLIGRDGRICVVDFGLARRDGQIEPRSSTTSAVSEDEVPLSVDTESLDPNPSGGLSLSITRTGMMLGTPAYMAPEQHMGVPPTAAADQFSFCVALYEALYGERPFAGKGPAELLINVTEGAVLPAPERSRVPAWIRAVLLRGIDRKPAARWPDMEALLQALASPPSHRRRQWALAGGLTLALAGGGVALWAAQQPEAPRCDDAAEHWAGHWDAATKARYAEAFAAIEKPFAQDAWRATERHGDAFVQRWNNTFTEACAATHERHTQSPEVLTLRYACLDRAQQRFVAVAEIFADADVEIVTDATDALRTLPAVDCGAAAVLREAAQLPDDPEKREAVEQQRQRLDRVRALGRANRWNEASTLVAQVVEQAEAIDDVTLRAQVRLVEAEIAEERGELAKARQSAQAALLLAETSDNDRLAADAWIELLWLDGFRDPRYEFAHAAAEHADALLARWPEAKEEKILLISRVGDLLYAQGHYTDALDRYRDALARGEALATPNDPRRADAFTGIGLCELELGQLDEALEHLKLAEGILRKSYGVGHPHMASALTNLGTAHDMREEYDEALALHGRALVVAETSYGPEHPAVAEILNNYAGALVARDRLDEAEVAFSRARSIWQHRYGSDHPDLAMLAYNLGLVAQLRGDNEAAARLHREALVGRERGLGPDHPDVADSLESLAELDVLAQRRDAAREKMKRAIDIQAAAFGADAEEVARMRKVLAEI